MLFIFASGLLQASRDYNPLNPFLRDLCASVAISSLKQPVLSPRLTLHLEMLVC